MCCGIHDNRLADSLLMTKNNVFLWRNKEKQNKTKKKKKKKKQQNTVYGYTLLHLYLDL